MKIYIIYIIYDYICVFVHYIEELIFSNVTCSGDEFSLSTCLGGEGGNDFELINCQSAVQLNCLGTRYFVCLFIIHV